jgi:osmotically-inducible protein OsmY
MKLLSLIKVQVALVLTVLIFAGCSAMTGRQTAGSAANDTALTTKVKSSLLADSMVGALALDVDTTEGVVSLNGIAKTEQERQRAIQVAQSVEGVRRVDARNLVVRR